MVEEPEPTLSEAVRHRLYEIFQDTNLAKNSREAQVLAAECMEYVPEDGVYSLRVMLDLIEERAGLHPSCGATVPVTGTRRLTPDPGLGRV